MTVTMSPPAPPTTTPEPAEPSEPVGLILTAEEYDALPENPRRELVDGVVRVMATPTPWHQDVKLALTAALKEVVPDEFRVTGEVEIRFDGLLRRNPDVLVVRAEGYDRKRPWLAPEQVLLAVEVVSPGSESTDRVLKPVEYARAGIPHFWRVETDPEVAVHTYRRDDRDGYVPTGIFTAGDVLAVPGLGWAKVAVDDLADEG